MDKDHQADAAWVLGVQRKLYQWSKAHPKDAWRDMWGWVTDLRVLPHAWRRVASNRGRRTAGIDGMTVGRIRNGTGEQRFLEGLQAELRSGAYQPGPVRRKLIPKAGRPGQFCLGIPTIKDRIVQGAVETPLEPIFEAQFWHVSFWHVSYGFRPGRRHMVPWSTSDGLPFPHTRGRDTRRSRMPYPWVIEGNIKGCFDNLSHHHLLERLRQRVADRRVTRLIGQFMKAGVLSEDQFLRTDAGTPQGGVLSPLLANIALSAIEERHERWVHQRTEAHADRECDGRIAARRACSWDRTAGRCVFLPVRDADDFVVLVSGTRKDAIAAKSVLAGELPAANHGPRVVAGNDEGNSNDGRIRVPRIPLRHALGQTLRLSPAH